MTTERSHLLQQFEALNVDPAAFGHREHLEVAFEMLHKYGFMDACGRYANAIEKIATRAGAPEKFNVTITLAFLSLLAERISRLPATTGFDDFLASNEDMLSKGALRQWYSDEQLQSDFARTHFMLPRPGA